MTDRGRDPVAISLRIFAVALFATMVWMLIWPSAFHAEVASFGDPNTHFIRDTATFVLPVAVALWLAASRPSWRIPVLVLVLVQNGAHVLNHILDVGATTTGWHGPANLVALLILEFALWQMLLHERREAARAA